MIKKHPIFWLLVTLIALSLFGTGCTSGPHTGVEESAAAVSHILNLMLYVLSATGTPSLSVRRPW